MTLQPLLIFFAVSFTTPSAIGVEIALGVVIMALAIVATVIVSIAVALLLCKKRSRQDYHVRSSGESKPRPSDLQLKKLPPAPASPSIDPPTFSTPPASSNGPLIPP